MFSPCYTCILQIQGTLELPLICPIAPSVIAPHVPNLQILDYLRVQSEDFFSYINFFGDHIDISGFENHLDIDNYKFLCLTEPLSLTPIYLTFQYIIPVISTSISNRHLKLLCTTLTDYVLSHSPQKREQNNITYNFHSF